MNALNFSQNYNVEFPKTSKIMYWKFLKFRVEQEKEINETASTFAFIAWIQVNAIK